MFGMAESNKSGGYTPFCGEFLRWPGKYKKRFAARLLSNIDVAPAHCFADAGAERFRNSFFRCETRSQMSRGKFHRYRILNLAVGENTAEKSIAKSVD